MKEPLYVCVHVPEFPVQALLRLRPELARAPVVVIAGDPPLEQVGVFSARELQCQPDGNRVCAAGAVIARQRPGTALGFIFLSMETKRASPTLSSTRSSTNVSAYW